MKIMTVYVASGFSKFRGIYDTHVFAIEDGLLRVYKVHPVTRQENLCAVFKDWTHMEMEDDGS